MSSKTFENEFLKSLDSLTKEQQEKALAYIKSILTKSQGEHGLLRFAGSLDANSIREMSEAIEAGCENSDTNEW
jgi:hypothetical protein